MLADLSPDVVRLERHCRRLLARGCDGINLLGTTGEATSLSIAQRRGAMEAIAASGLPLERFMVGTGASALADAAALTSYAVELGFAGALVIPPFYFKDVPEDGVFAFYASLIERVANPQLSLYLYHFPALSGVPFALSLIERLVRAYPTTIVGLKDSSGDMDYAQSVAATFPSLDVFPSTEGALGSARGAGYAGCISATVNVTAPLAGEVWNSGGAAGAESAAQHALAHLRGTIARYPLVPAIRHIVANLDGDPGWLRLLPPLAPLARDDMSALDAALAASPAFATIAASFGRAGDEAAR